MRRRRLLALAAGLAPTAGCLAQGPGTASPTTEDPCSSASVPAEPTLATPTETGRTREVADGATATVAPVGVRRLVRTFEVDSPVHVDVAGAANRQFLVAVVTVRDDGTPTTPDGESPPVGVSVDGRRDPEGPPYIVGDRYGWTAGGTALAFPVPVESPDAAAVVWGSPGDVDARWPLSDALLARMGRAPAFEVTAFEVPDRVEAGTRFPVRVAVGNDGDRDGRFLAEFGARVVSDVGEVAFPVPAGETVERCLLADAPEYTEDSGTFPVVLDWGVDRRRESVTLA